jgi:transposase-like protein
MKDIPFYQNYEWLYDQYINKQKNVREIAKECNCDPTTICNWMRKHKILPRAGKPPVGNIPWNKNLTKENDIRVNKSSCKNKISHIKFEELTDRNWLESQYLIQNKSQKQIANEIGCKCCTVGKWIRKHNIPLRTTSEAIIIKNLLYSSKIWQNKETLHNEYIINNKSMKQLSIEFNCDVGTIKYWLTKFDIKIRKRENQKGENNYYWKGGISCLPYCPKFNNAFKENIRNKFNRKCFNCNVHENKRISKEGRMAVHHIDYNKNSICNGKEWAFVPLCNSCHSRSNGKRWFWFNLLLNYWSMNDEINLENSPFRSEIFLERKYIYKSEIKI